MIRLKISLKNLYNLNYIKLCAINLHISKIYSFFINPLPNKLILIKCQNMI